MASETAPLPNTTDPAARAADAPNWLSTLTYRSRSVSPMSELDLYRLLKSAQSRNHAEGVTGVMVYDCGWIFQQLEGPAAGVARIWDSIRRDRRHGEIEVLGDAPTRDRRYAEWDLKLSIHGARAGHTPRGASEPPPELISRLYRGEQQANQLPAGWVDAVTPPDDALRDAPRSAAQTRATLAALLKTVIIPRLITAHAGEGLPVSPEQTALLARLLIAPDKERAFALVKAEHARHGSMKWLALQLVEPAARSLGNLWHADDCSEIEVTLGLLRLQGFFRQLESEVPRANAKRQPIVLVVPQPGEAHILGASLDAELLWRAGWNPQVEFPTSSGALDSLVASTWIDALDLSMSTAFRREHRLGQLTETIAHARTASLNPDLVVVVSGRAFTTYGTADGAELAAQGGPDAAQGSDVGADASFGSSSQAEAVIRYALQMPRSGG